MAPCQPAQEAPRSCNLPQHPCALLQNPCLQPFSALKQPFLSAFNSGFRVSLILAEIQPQYFTTKHRFGFPPPPCCSIAQQLHWLQPGHSIVLGKGETASPCKAPGGVFWCNTPVKPIEQDRDRPEGKA